MSTPAKPIVTPRKKPDPNDHPAKFHPKILAAIRELLDKWHPGGGMLVDPFAGTGKIHQLREPSAPETRNDESRWSTLGIEIEHEWADLSPWTQQGDALQVPVNQGTADAVVTSPCYGNRMADCHENRDACSACKGEGVIERAATPDEVDNGCELGVAYDDCKKCKGEGVSRRLTYRHRLGRMPSEGSAAIMQWGTEYRRFHELAIREMIRVVKCEDDVDEADQEPSGLIVVNMANHPRDDVEQLVVEWWTNALLFTGCRLLEVVHVDTPGMGFGENMHDGIEGEKLIVVRTPPTRRLL